MLWNLSPSEIETAHRRLGLAQKAQLSKSNSLKGFDDKIFKPDMTHRH